MQPATRVWLRRAAWLIGLAVLAVVTWLAWQQLRPAGLAAGLAGGNGRIEAVEVDIAAREGGRIREILVNEGDFVTAGQELARLDTQQLEARLYNWQDSIESNAVEVHVHHLRRKLGSSLIHTMRGVGYFIPRESGA